MYRKYQSTLTRYLKSNSFSNYICNWLAKQELKISDLKVEDYPTKQFLDRLSPFVPRKTIDELKKLFTEESLLQVKGDFEKRFDGTKGLFKIKALP